MVVRASDPEQVGKEMQFEVGIQMELFLEILEELYI